MRGALSLDHVNIRTPRVAELTEFYGRILGLVPGPRPPFSFPGAWLYCGERAVVHLVEVAASELASAAADQLRLSHFAFTATGRDEVISRLRAAGIPHRVTRLPGTPVTQVHLEDPDGNALHLDFADG